ncbi:hypothetical protein PENDEC_c030G01842 [Penicillium decumbens]|uniref:Uncharacterized protein n=1 Tax=Penicillium decumbens TaxID=69771 RepID=A0A1V6NW75_PENDC|nr:hypothetical protein PENDEC_c030G01842 [Penicillium decumbens]
MAKYISVPIINEFITFVENDSDYEDNVKAMLSGTLSYCFPAVMGYGLAPKQNRNNSYPVFIFYRLQHRFPGDWGVVDHALIEAKRSSDSLQESIDQLTNALEGSNTEHGRCWAILEIGVNISFYEYCHHFPVNRRLLPWCPPGQSTNSFRIRHDNEIIDWIFNPMRPNNESPAR